MSLVFVIHVTHVDEVSVSLRLCSPFLLHALLAALLPPLLALEARGQFAAHFSQSEYGFVKDLRRTTMSEGAKKTINPTM